MTQIALKLVGATVAAYLIGSIPFGLIIGKLFFKADPRDYGSGNIGATNVWRTFGPVAGGFTLALDILKGSVAAFVALWLVPEASGGVAHELAGILAMGAAMAGHTYPVFLKFKGGKGVATAGGAVIVLYTALGGWQVWALEIVLFAIVVIATRMVSAGSIAMAVGLPILTAIFLPGRFEPGWWLMLAFAIVAAALVIWRHRSNIGRIWRGQENTLTWTPSRRPSAPPKSKGE